MEITIPIHVGASTKLLASMGNFVQLNLILTSAVSMLNRINRRLLSYNSMESNKLQDPNPS